MKGDIFEDDINKKVKLIDCEDNLYIGILRKYEFGLIGYQMFEVEFEKEKRWFNEKRLKSIEVIK